MKTYHIAIALWVAFAIIWFGGKFFFGPYCAARVLEISPLINKDQDQVCKVVVLYNSDTALIKVKAVDRAKIHNDTISSYSRNLKSGELSIGDTITVSERKNLLLKTWYEPEFHIKLVGFVGGERVWF